jgi:hypothetical protein
MAFQLPDREFFFHSFIAGLVYCAFYYMNNQSLPGTALFSQVVLAGAPVQIIYILLYSYITGIFLTLAGLFITDLIFQVDDQELSEQILPWPFSGKKLVFSKIEEYFQSSPCACTLEFGVFRLSEVLFGLSVLFAGISMAILFSNLDLEFNFVKMVVLLLLVLFLRVFGGIMKEFEPMVGAALLLLLLYATHPSMEQAVLSGFFFVLAVILRGTANYYLWRALPNL